MNNLGKRIKGSKSYKELISQALSTLGVNEFRNDLEYVFDLFGDYNIDPLFYNLYLNKEGVVLPYRYEDDRTKVATDFREIGLDTLFLYKDFLFEKPLGKEAIKKIISFSTHDTVYYTVNNGIKHPHKAHNTDAGFDIFAAQNYTIPPNMGCCVINSSIKLILPPNYTCDLRGRSGLASKGIIAHYGTVDADYRGVVGPILFNTTKEPYYIKKNDKVAQLVFLPLFGNNLPIKMVYLSEENFINHPSFVTVRDIKGFGSTGK